ncbi:MAG: hypothetical protein K6A71_08310 [Lachnospiraceae bacterium]|nr:hypothetical protein [Lachnospiraceae bacterium]
MDTKKVPLFIMLLAAAVACIVTYLYHYSLHDTLIVLIIVLILFLILGSLVKKLLDKFEISNNETVDDEGEVVEKTSEGEGAEEGDAGTVTELSEPAGAGEAEGTQESTQSGEG